MIAHFLRVSERRTTKERRKREIPSVRPTDDPTLTIFSFFYQMTFDSERRGT
jgi:hypothetical protein